MEERISYSYCRICGSEPSGAFPEPNVVVKYWEPDDGWSFGALCRGCRDEFGDAQPHPDDYAYADQYHIGNVHTDEDITGLI